VAVETHSRSCWYRIRGLAPVAYGQPVAYPRSDGPNIAIFVGYRRVEPAISPQEYDRGVGLCRPGTFEARAFDEDAGTDDLIQEREAKIAVVERMVGSRVLDPGGLSIVGGMPVDRDIS
jgi:hypothetical protein